VKDKDKDKDKGKEEIINMPLYGSQPAQVLMSGVPYFFFNGETPVAPAKSVSMVMPGVGGGLYVPIIFSIQFVINPLILLPGNPALADTLILQAAVQDVDSLYQNLYTSSGKALDYITDFAIFPFYRFFLQSWNSVGSLTAVAIRR
jgi:hypothetical protein